MSVADRVDNMARDLICSANLNISKLPYLKSCCPAGAPTCDQCIYNLRFRGGHQDYCLSERKLISRVVKGLKPLGTIARHDLDHELECFLRQRNLTILMAGKRNIWGMHMYIFAKNPELRLGELCDLNAICNVCGIHIADQSIEKYVTKTDDFLNEYDTFVGRGIVYGYPLWSSIALSVLINNAQNKK